MKKHYNSINSLQDSMYVDKLVFPSRLHRFLMYGISVIGLIGLAIAFFFMTPPDELLSTTETSVIILIASLLMLLVVFNIAYSAAVTYICFLNPRKGKSKDNVNG